MVSTGRSFLRRAAAALGATAILTAGIAAPASAAPANPAQQDFYNNARQMINSPGVPPEISGVLNKGLDFLTGEGGGEPGFNIPDQAPQTNQFLLPTIAEKCIGGEGRSFGLATSVPGPAPLPLPGVPADQLGFIFTGLGTKQLAKQQNTEMNVYWINVANGKYGKTTLTNNGINAQKGPGAVNGTANTGKGLVFAVMQGGITTAESSGPTNCNYTPTAGVFPVGW